MTSRHIAAIIALSVLLPFAASALSVDDIQQQIRNLLAQVAQLQEQLRNLQTNPPVIACTQDARVCPDGTAVGRTGPRCEFAPCPGETQPVPPYRCPDIKRTLYRGMSGDDVADVQEVLGVERTGFFGAKTEAAVQALQAREGIVSAGDAATTGWGYIGPRTREAFLRRCGGRDQNFTASPTSGAAPLAVSFSARSGTNLSSENYSIDFGDGTNGRMTGVYGICQDGVGGPCNGGNNMMASHTYQNIGTYTATLRESNAGGCPGGSSQSCLGSPAYMRVVGAITITVGGDIPVNPTFSASPTSGTAPLAVIFRSNIVNNLDSYSIDFGDNSSGVWQNNCQLGYGACGMPTANHTYTANGTYVAKLKKLTGMTASLPGTPIYETVGTVTIAVAGNSGGVVPSINGLDAPTSLQVGQTGTWTVRASVPSQDNAQLRYSVVWGDEYPNFDIMSAQLAAPHLQTNATFTHAYQRAGTFSPVFTVSNNSGSARTSASVTVSDILVCTAMYRVCPAGTHNGGQCNQDCLPDNQPTAFSASPTTGQAPLNVNFSMAPQAGKQAQDYVVEFGDGGYQRLSDGCVPSVGGDACRLAWTTNHTYASAGTYTATLNGYVACLYATEYRCMMAQQPLGTVTITVGGTTGSQALSATPTSGGAPLYVTFRAPIPNGSSASDYSIVFGDGTSGVMYPDGTNCIALDGASCPVVPITSMFSSHTYSSPGTYNAMLYDNRRDCAQNTSCALGAVTITVGALWL